MKKTHSFTLLILWLSFVFSQCTPPTISDDKNTINHLDAPQLLSHKNNDASCVFLSKDENNKPMINWVEIDSTEKKHAFLAFWNDEKQIFDEAVQLPIPQNTSIHEEGMPKVIAKKDGTYFAFFETTIESEYSKWGISDIVYSISTNRGKTWTETKSVHPHKLENASISFSGITQLNDGEIGIAWLGTNQDKSQEGRPVQFSKTNEDNYFSKPVIVSKQACECCRVALSSNKNNEIGVVFRDLLPHSTRDISLSISNDNGATFYPIPDVSNDHWEINGCPHNGPAVVKTNACNHVTWSTGGRNQGVHYAQIDKKGKILKRSQISEKGRFIQLCLLRDETAVTTYSRMSEENGKSISEIVINKITDTELLEKIISDTATHGNYPVIEAIDSQNVVVAWTDADANIQYRSVSVASIQDKTDSFSSPYTKPFTKKIAKEETVIDPVCGMRIHPSTVTDSIVKENGYIYLCSPHCLRKYQEHPERFEE